MNNKKSERLGRSKTMRIIVVAVILALLGWLIADVVTAPKSDISVGLPSVDASAGISPEPSPAPDIDTLQAKDFTGIKFSPLTSDPAGEKTWLCGTDAAVSPDFEGLATADVCAELAALHGACVSAGYATENCRYGSLPLADGDVAPSNNSNSSPAEVPIPEGMGGDFQPGATPSVSGPDAGVADLSRPTSVSSSSTTVASNLRVSKVTPQANPNGSTDLLADDGTSMGNLAPQSVTEAPVAPETTSRVNPDGSTSILDGQGREISKLLPSIQVQKNAQTYTCIFNGVVVATSSLNCDADFAKAAGH